MHYWLSAFGLPWKSIRKKITFIGSTLSHVLYSLALPLRKKCPNTEFLLVRILLYSDWIDLLDKSLYSVLIQENTDQKKLRIWTLFTHCVLNVTCNQNDNYLLKVNKRKTRTRCEICSMLVINTSEQQQWRLYY